MWTEMIVVAQVQNQTPYFAYFLSMYCLSPPLRLISKGFHGRGAKMYVLCVFLKLKTPLVSCIHYPVAIFVQIQNGSLLQKSDLPIFDLVTGID